MISYSVNQSWQGQTTRKGRAQSCGSKILSLRGCLMKTKQFR